MDDDDDPIDPTTFDLIVIGMGLPGSVIAAAASASGKTVFHLDPNNFYGSHFASLPLDDFTFFLNSHASPPSSTTTINITSNSNDYTTLRLTPRLLYSDIETTTYSPQVLAQHHPKRFSIDLAGPRVLYCADKAIDLMLKSGVSHMKFKSIDMNFIFDETGELQTVPDSRAAIFKDKSLSLIEKNKLMRFFKLVWQHLDAEASDGDDQQSLKISDEDLESPFVDFLKRMQLPRKIITVILYAIAMIDNDQDNVKVRKSLLKTRDGIERLTLYHKSRLTNAPLAMIYPKYGHGDLTDVFCHRAAVRGCVYARRVPVAVLMDKDSGQYKGVRLASGQHLFSNQLVLDPTFIVPFPPAESVPDLRESLQVLSLKDDKRRVARAICITTSSLKPDISNCLFVYPPRSLCPDQDTSIRGIQIGGGSAEICPRGMNLLYPTWFTFFWSEFVLYFSALCDDSEQGKRLLSAAMNKLFAIPVSGNPHGWTVHSDAEVKPPLLWSTFYIQELTMDQHEYFISTPMPDASLNYNDLIDATMVLFRRMYPHEEFFPMTSEHTNLEDDAELILECSRSFLTLLGIDCTISIDTTM